jgi:hypothetical protein
MRAVLVQASWAALLSRRHRNDPMMIWAREVARRRGKKIAVVALARKLSGVLFAMWRDGTDYDATQAAKVIPAAPRRLVLNEDSRRSPRPESNDPGLTVASYVAAQFVSEAFGRVGPSCPSEADRVGSPKARTLLHRPGPRPLDFGASTDSHPCADPHPSSSTETVTKSAYSRLRQVGSAPLCASITTPIHLTRTTPTAGDRRSLSLTSQPLHSRAPPLKTGGRFTDHHNTNARH